MRAALFQGPGHLELVADRPVPTPGVGEVLVRVTSAGICGSDLAEYRHGPIMTAPRADGSYEPVVLGHEFGGTVVTLGAGVEGFDVGDQVMCGGTCSCGECPDCRNGRANLCKRKYTLGYHRDGGLAEYCAAPIRSLVNASPYALAADTLALAQPMAIAVHAVRRAALHEGELAVVVGVGGVGAFLTYAAARVGAHVWASDIDPHRLALAAGLGAAETIDVRTTTPQRALDDAAQRADVVFEVSGTPAGWASAIAAAAPGSRIVPIGMQKHDLQVSLGTWTMREYSVIGAVAQSADRDLPTAVEYIADRAGGWADLAPRMQTLEEIVESGLEVPPRHADHAPVKILIDPAAHAERPAAHEIAVRAD